MDRMGRALQLAERALGWCSPNPAVGAVIARDDEVVGEGYTQPAGGPHAEIVALRAAGRSAAGASLYVTLEPCCHHGRTPPCTDAVIAGGITQVHVATVDPSSWVNGGGIRALEAAGVAVHLGSRQRDARRLNEAYFKWIATGLPFVTLKYAMTADGKIATRTGSSRWITGPKARAYVARMRSQVDAVLVGVGTVLADDPQLTARPEEFRAGDGEPVHQPLRVVLDSSGRTPPTARLLSDELPGRTLVWVTERAGGDRRAELEASGAEVLVAPESDGGVDARAVMQELGNRGIISVLAEPGGTLAASLLGAGLVDRVLVFVAPKLVGGSEAPTPIGGEGIADMAAALELDDPRWTVLGRDVLLSGYLRQPGGPGSLET